MRETASFEPKKAGDGFELAVGCSLERYIKTRKIFVILHPFLEICTKFIQGSPRGRYQLFYIFFVDR